MASNTDPRPRRQQNGLSFQYSGLGFIVWDTKTNSKVDIVRVPTAPGEDKTAAQARAAQSWLDKAHVLR